MDGRWSQKPGTSPGREYEERWSVFRRFQLHVEVGKGEWKWSGRRGNRIDWDEGGDRWNEPVFIEAYMHTVYRLSWPRKQVGNWKGLCYSFDYLGKS